MYLPEDITTYIQSLVPRDYVLVRYSIDDIYFLHFIKENHYIIYIIKQLLKFFNVQFIKDDDGSIYIFTTSDIKTIQMIQPGIDSEIRVSNSIKHDTTHVFNLMVQYFNAEMYRKKDIFRQLRKQFMKALEDI